MQEEVRSSSILVSPALQGCASGYEQGPQPHQLSRGGIYPAQAMGIRLRSSPSIMTGHRVHGHAQRHRKLTTSMQLCTQLEMDPLLHPDMPLPEVGLEGRDTPLMEGH